MTGCIQQDLGDGINKGESPVFTASFVDASTRTFLDSSHRLLWSSEDELTIFTTTYNQRYIFKGETGSTSGDFEEAKVSGFHSGNTISTNYAVYPYQSVTKMSNDEVITLELPAVQTYAAGTFGVGANTMVAVTSSADDYFLPFKNVCGYLVVKLYGEGSVINLTFKGNSGEKIAGSATVVAEYGKNPEMTMSDAATDCITIDCGEDGLALGKSAEEATEFWFCVPPTTFSKGFTVTATNKEGMSMIKKVSSSKTFPRNVINSMPATEAIFDTRLGNIEFEDANFKAYCVDNFDRDGDGEVSYTEAKNVKRMICSSKEIKSLKGIESFTEISYLSCRDNQLSSLDVSKNTQLDSLYCYNNQLTSLDVSQSSELLLLSCFNNQLTSLDISKNTELTLLSCYSNQLTSLDVSKNTSLDYLDCSPMETLESVYVAQGQLIPHITTNRSTSYIPAAAEIVVAGAYKMVDLGLGVKWATFNVGADLPWEFGDSYAWGSTYIGGPDKQSKYEPSETKDVLDPEDDVAAVLWGGSWRMPTSSEYDELRDKCTWEWTTMNGVEGCKFTSIINGNSVFFPANDDRECLYWSSSICKQARWDAWLTVLKPNNAPYMAGINICCQFFVRPVFDERNGNRNSIESPRKGSDWGW